MAKQPFACFCILRNNHLLVFIWLIINIIRNTNNHLLVFQKSKNNQLLVLLVFACFSS